MKKTVVSFIAILLGVPIVFAASFSDVPQEHPQYEAIELLRNMGVINGYLDGTFAPENPVNRAAALKMILLSADIHTEQTVTDSGFGDVSSEQWYAPLAAKAKELLIVKGDGETGNFSGERQVNKVEFLKMLFQAFDEDLSYHENLTQAIASDVPIGDWTVPYLSYAKILGIISPSLDGRLNAGSILSRGETAEIIYKLLIIKRGGDTQKFLNIAESKLVDVKVNLNANDITAALKNVNDAIFYSEQALAKAPDEGIVKAALKISQGFLELCLGHKAMLEGKYDELLEHADKADELAGLAYVDAPSTQTLGKQIKAQSLMLRDQVPETPESGQEY